MDNIEMNQKCVHLLEQWDPFSYGTDSYSTETADVVAALQNIDDQQHWQKSFKEFMNTLLNNGFHSSNVLQSLIN